MLTGELWGMEQSIPMAISRETRSPEIQHFPWASGKQLRSCTNLRRPPSSFCCAPTAGRGRPISQQLTDRRCKPSWTRLQVQSGQPWRRIHGENSGVSLGRSRRSPGSAWGHASREETSFSGPTAQGSFAAASLRAFDVCTCPCIDPPLPGRRFYPERFTAVLVYAALMAGNPMATHSSTLAWKNPMDRGAW